MIEMRKKDKILMRSEGFTLVELVVAMGVTAILGAVLMTQFLHHMDMYVRQKARIDTQQKVRTVLMWMEDEFRMAGFNPTALQEPAVGVISASSREFVFSFREEDSKKRDGKWDTRDWKLLSYFIKEDGTVQRREKKPSENLIGTGITEKDEAEYSSGGAVASLLNHARLNFVYLDRHQNIIPAPQPADYSRIRAVRIEMGATYTDRKGREGAVDLVTTVKCRNLGIGS